MPSKKTPGQAAYEHWRENVARVNEEYLFVQPWDLLNVRQKALWEEIARAARRA